MREITVFLSTQKLPSRPRWGRIRRLLRAIMILLFR